MKKPKKLILAFASMLIYLVLGPLMISCDKEDEIVDEHPKPIWDLSHYIVFGTTEHVNDFQLDYPGVTVIPGDVWISAGAHSEPGSVSLDLTGLSVLTEIGGNLYIEGANLTGNPFGTSKAILIESLWGLHNLKTIGGDFEMKKTRVMTSMEGLNSLSTIGGSFKLEENWALESLTGLESLDTVGGEITLRLNYNLTDCAIQPVCDFLDNGAPFDIFNNGPQCDSLPELMDACN